jgi:hypothetical protein
MSEPELQVQKDAPPTLVNSEWVKWAHRRIAELEQQLAEQKRLADPLTKAMYKEMSARHSEVCSQLVALREAARKVIYHRRHFTESDNQETSLDQLAALLKQEGE